MPALTQEAREAAQDAGRRLIGVWAPDALREAMAEVALAGAVAALAVQPVAPGGRCVPEVVRSAAERRATKGAWAYGRRILWGPSAVEDRTLARDSVVPDTGVNYVLELLEAEKATEGAASGVVLASDNSSSYGPSGTTP